METRIEHMNWGATAHIGAAVEVDFPLSAPIGSWERGLVGDVAGIAFRVRKTQVLYAQESGWRCRVTLEDGATNEDLARVVNCLGPLVAALDIRGLSNPHPEA